MTFWAPTGLSADMALTLVDSDAQFQSIVQGLSSNYVTVQGRALASLPNAYKYNSVSDPSWTAQTINTNELNFIIHGGSRNFGLTSNGIFSSGFRNTGGIGLGIHGQGDGAAWTVVSPTFIGSTIHATTSFRYGSGAPSSADHTGGDVAFVGGNDLGVMFRATATGVIVSFGNLVGGMAVRGMCWADSVSKMFAVGTHASGTADKAWVSTDKGSTWAAVTVPTKTNLKAVAWSTVTAADAQMAVPKGMMLQSDTSANTTVPYFYSTNAVDWSQGTLTNSWWNSICHINALDLFVIVGERPGYPGAAYSSDLLTWTYLTPASDHPWTDCVWEVGSSKVLACARDGYVMWITFS